MKISDIEDVMELQHERNDLLTRLDKIDDHAFFRASVGTLWCEIMDDDVGVKMRQLVKSQIIANIHAVNAKLAALGVELD